MINELTFASLVENSFLIVGVYLLMGVIFYLYFSSKEMKKLDSSTQETSLWFKLIIAPGCIALWIFLLIKLYRIKK